jgi:sugar lactone lactonase YvrE
MTRRVAAALLSVVAVALSTIPLAGMGPAAAAAAGTITTVAGGVASGPAGTIGSLFTGVTVRNGRAYVGDAVHHVVREIDLATGATRVIAGVGAPGSTGDGGPASAATFQQPRDLVFDAAGNLYIADSIAHLVRKVDTAGRVSTFAGGGSPADGVGDGGPATAAGVSPTGLAFDAAGNLHIADAGRVGRVRRVDGAGRITTVAGGGDPAEGVGDGGPATAAFLANPSAIVFDAAGNLFVAENARLRKVTPTGIISSLTYAGTSQLVYVNYPRSLAIDAGGALVVAQGDRIERITQAGAFSVVVGPNGGTSPLGAPNDLWVDGSGSIFVTDDRFVRRVSPAGAVTNVAGNGTRGFTGEGTAATNAELGLPAGVAVHPDGTVYIRDAGNGRIRKVSPAGVISTLAIVSEESGLLYPQNPGAVQTSIGVDLAGNVFVVVGYALTKVTPAGVVSTIFRKESALGAIAVEPDGAVYVVEDEPRGTVRRIDPSGAQSVVIHDLYNTNGVVPEVPSGLALDGRGHLYVAAGDIYRYTVATKALIRVASPPQNERALGALTVDKAGNVYYDPTDLTGFGLFDVPLGGTMIKRIDPEGFVTHVAGKLRTWGYSGDGASSRTALFHGLGSMALDAAGHLFVADVVNNRIRRIESPAAIPRDGGAARVGVLSKDELWLRQTFQLLLSRSPTAAEESFWKGQLAGGLDRIHIAGGVVTSAEYRRLLVRAVYMISLQREPTGPEANWGLAAVEIYGVNVLAANLLATDEAVLRHGGTETAWLQFLYRLVSGRAPDPAVISFWAQQRTAGLPRLSVASAFLTWQDAYRGVVAGAYGQFLGRAADAAGSQFWVDQMLRGLRQEYVYAYFVASNEFYARFPDHVTVTGKT